MGEVPRWHVVGDLGGRRFGEVASSEFLLVFLRSHRG